MIQRQQSGIKKLNDEEHKEELTQVPQCPKQICKSLENYNTTLCIFDSPWYVQIYVIELANADWVEILTEQ